MTGTRFCLDMGSGKDFISTSIPLYASEVLNISPQLQNTNYMTEYGIVNRVSRKYSWIKALRLQILKLSVTENKMFKEMRMKTKTNDSRDRILFHLFSALILLLQFGLESRISKLSFSAELTRKLYGVLHFFFSVFF